jgi:hypothetical protein
MAISAGVTPSSPQQRRLLTSRRRATATDAPQYCLKTLVRAA